MMRTPSPEPDEEVGDRPAPPPHGVGYWATTTRSWSAATTVAAGAAAAQSTAVPVFVHEYQAPLGVSSCTSIVEPAMGAESRVKVTASAVVGSVAFSS